MSFWTFDDVFEETGVVQDPFHGGFGLIAAGGIRKPSYNAFALLHKLGHERLANFAASVLVTRREDGTLAVAVWNLVDPDRKGTPRFIHLEVRGLSGSRRAVITRVDAAHGNTLAAYAATGKPRYPTPAQIAELNEAAEPAAQIVSLNHNSLDLEIPVNGLALLEVAQ